MNEPASAIESYVSRIKASCRKHFMGDEINACEATLMGARPDYYVC